MIQPALRHLEPLNIVSPPYWIWPILAVVLASIGVAVYAMRALAKREETIRRQLAREASLKARFDAVFERSSDIMAVHDRRGRLSPRRRAGEQTLACSREQ